MSRVTERRDRVGLSWGVLAGVFASVQLLSFAPAIADPEVTPDHDALTRKKAAIGALLIRESKRREKLKAESKPGHSQPTGSKHEAGQKKPKSLFSAPAKPTWR